MDQPLLRIGSHPSIGQNTNGPCVVRVPEWVTNPLARFYMYFAHHTGTYIRMAVSDDLLGPWRVVDTPPLHLSETRFAQEPVTHQTATGDVVTEPAHIASPDVHILEESRQIVMLFHGLNEDGNQTTGIATSTDGATFSTEGFETDVAPPYLRLCSVGGRFIGVSWGGQIFTSDSPFGPFEKGPPLLERPNGPGLIPRHPALVWRNNRLHCFYSLIGDCPERIWHVAAKPGVTWDDWQLGEPHTLLAPEVEWEGSELPKFPSRIGAATKIENALRDPFVCENHIFYVGGGESCIAAAHLHWS
ncbi:MAG: hypothetical protein QNJ20_06945 [Paracoccaceae bacterium]|nr:hypothetical protein [Paracoccaceae bacterium]